MKIVPAEMVSSYLRYISLWMLAMVAFNYLLIGIYPGAFEFFLSVLFADYNWWRRYEG